MTKLSDLKTKEPNIFEKKQGLRGLETRTTPYEQVIGKNPNIFEDITGLMGGHEWSLMREPVHIFKFKRDYKRLRETGFFETVEKTFTENPDNFPKIFTDFVIIIARTIVREKKWENKYKYYQALLAITDYLTGKLHG